VDRWNWTWEEPRPEAPPEQEPAPDPAGGGAPEPASARSGDFRRRRIGAAIIVVAILALLIATVARSGPHHPDRASIQHSATRHAAAVRLSTAQQNALTDQREGRAIDRVLSYTPAVTRGGTRGNEVALTFDDGPGPYTERVVGVLNSLGVHATFFAIGEEERYFSGGTRLELRSGDVVGDHTETHPMLASLSRHDQHEELFEQIARIELLGGSRPRLFRPPYGSFDATTFKELHAMRLLMVLWSTDTRDFTVPGVQTIVQRALAGAQPGAIILMHDAGGNRQETIEALPAIIAGLHRKGLHAVTVPRLMLDDPPPRGLPIPTALTGD
jgi:peptidoglycan/xylan/chitin deacetylase (PgdA/CDA1 family)